MPEEHHVSTCTNQNHQNLWCILLPLIMWLILWKCSFLMGGKWSQTLSSLTFKVSQLKKRINPMLKIDPAFMSRICFREGWEYQRRNYENLSSYLLWRVAWGLRSCWEKARLTPAFQQVTGLYSGGGGGAKKMIPVSFFLFAASKSGVAKIYLLSFWKSPDCLTASALSVQVQSDSLILILALCTVLLMMIHEGWVMDGVVRPESLDVTVAQQHYIHIW